MRGRRGEGTVTARDGKYLARWSRTEGGRRVRHAKTFTFKTDAEWWLREAKRQGSPPETGTTVAQYLEGWLRGKRRIAESTRLQYENHVRVHLAPVIGHIPLADLQRRHVEAFIEDRLGYVSPATKRRLTPSTVGKLLTTLRSALESGVPREIPDNPAAKVEAPRVRRAKVQAMTVEEAGRLVEAVRGTWTEFIVRFLLGSGVRIGEAVALNQGDVEEWFVRLRKSKTTLRAVPVSEDGMAALRSAIATAPRRGKDEPVFFSPRPNRQGVRDRLDRGSVQHALPRILKAAGLRRLTPHGLRHGTATLMLAGGASMRVIADQLGHANPSMTANIYAHVDPAHLRRSLDVLDKAVKR